MSSSARSAFICAASQGAHGGWPLFQDGAFNISASVKAYFALKMIGDDIDAPHMARAREAILAHGGAAQSNVFTRSLLALYGEIPWRGVPVMPVGDHAAAELVPLPSRQDVLLGAHGARAAARADGQEAAREKSGTACISANCSPRRRDEVKVWPKGEHQTWPWAHIFGEVDKILRVVEPYFPEAHARTRRSEGRALDDGAPERRRRSRRDLPGDGQQPLDV